MKINLNATPPPIEIEPQKDGEKIVIKHRYLNAIERAELFDALSMGVGGAMAYMLGFVVAWTNIEDMNGRIIPTHQLNESGQTVSVVPDVIGMLPMSAQIEIWIQQVVANGIEYRRVEKLAREFLGEEESKRIGGAAVAMGKPLPTEPIESSTS